MLSRKQFLFQPDRSNYDPLNGCKPVAFDEVGTPKSGFRWTAGWQKRQLQSLKEL